MPSFNGTLPKTLIIPAAIGVGLGLACAVLLFPRSTSHIVLASMEGLLSLSKLPLNFTLASLMNNEDLTLEQLHETKAKIIGVYKEMEPALAFLPLDFSMGRWNADDINSLRGHIRRTMAASLSLLEFHTTRVRSNVRLKRLTAASNVEVDNTDKTNENRPNQAGLRELMEHMKLMQAFQSPEGEALQLETIETLRESSAAILPACQDAMEAAVKCIHTANSRRWFGRPSKEQNEQLVAKSRDILEALGSARSSFASETTERLLQKHSDAFDESGNLKKGDTLATHSVRGIMIGMMFEEHVIGLADASEKLLSHVITLLQHRPGVRIWFPTSIRYAAAWLFRREVAAPVRTSDDVDPDEAGAQTKEAQRRLQISRGYTMKKRSGLGKAVLGTYHWFISTEGLYALRLVVVTIALAIPAVIPSSAGFYYRVKGIWGLIMAQTAVVVYMADFTFSAVCRVIGTVIGGVVGLVAWYIGSGHGPGNSYGLGAIMAAVCIIFMWARLFFPPALLQATVLGAATCMLIIGYSYDFT